jgi:hypothetical protein
MVSPISMEAGGIEPPSAVAPNRTSTSVVCDLISPGGRCADDLPTGQPILWSHPSGDQRSFGASPFSDAATRITGRIRSDASPNYLGGECEIVIRTYVDSRWINEANRGPRLAARPENRPRRNLVAPVCVLQEHCNPGKARGRLAATPLFPGVGALFTARPASGRAGAWRSRRGRPRPACARGRRTRSAAGSERSGTPSSGGT